MKAICCIPARLESSRLPEKVLLDVAGMPLVCRTARAALDCDRFGLVAVLVDDDRTAVVIFEHLIEPNQDKEDPDERRYWDRLVVFRVEGDYACGTDRVAAFVRRNIPEDVTDLCVVNLQADEPEASPEAISRLVDLIEGGAEMATLAAVGDPRDKEWRDESCVFVRVEHGYAASFHRGQPRWMTPPHWWRLHVGAYAFSRQALERFSAHGPEAIEREHSLEQLRTFGMDPRLKIAVAIVPHEGRGVNTQEDYEALVRRTESRRLARSLAKNHDFMDELARSLHKERVRQSSRKMIDIHHDTFRNLED